MGSLRSIEKHKFMDLPSRLCRVAVVLILSSLWLLPGPVKAATKIFTSADVGNSTGQAITGYYGQRKLVRDADGYWYVVVGA